MACACSKSAIRFNETKPDKQQADTPDIVSGDEFRRFWITFKQNVIRCGREGEEAPLLEWHNTDEPFKVTHFGSVFNEIRNPTRFPSPVAPESAVDGHCWNGCERIPDFISISLRRLA